ncbi:MAG TPA: hypothetical protein H9871_07190 [Candidatus Nesterenkonia stercoripullorum]|uniref:Uncharacterized protein n=1 Tax=Candidatus Nesterenkonia stercoripullorum TaxID=2838701 RepID=A0A9D1UT38_9MICC|nr:hypothetical protein [Candidatus Nesterenkonia stercoripullorum]
MSTRRHPARSKLAVALCLGAILIGGLRSDFAVPTTTAGFTDSTYGAASLTTTAKVPVEAVKYDQSAASALFLSDSGGLYISGYRGTGDGNGGKPNAQAEPNRVKFPEGVQIIDATGSTNDFNAIFADTTTSFMALDAEGGVWTWGRVYGVRDLIGRGDISRAGSRYVGQVTATAEGRSLPPIARMARTENQFLALDYEGTMWVWGYGGENMPTPDKYGDAPLPVRANHTTAAPSLLTCSGNRDNNLGPVPFRSIWSGNNAGGAVGQNGLLYTWGFDNSDALGGLVTNTRCPSLNEGANRELFQRYPELYTTAEGEIYDEGELSTEEERHERYVEIAEAMRRGEFPVCAGVVEGPGPDTSGCPVRQFGHSSGAAHLLTSGGELLTWMTRKGYGEPFLGREPTPSSPARRPAPVTGDLRFDEVTAGVSSLVALSTDGRVYGWGSNNLCQAVGVMTEYGTPTDGDCGDGGKESDAAVVVVPQLVDGIPEGTPATSISATQCAAWATLADGSAYGWGAGTAAGYGFSQCRQPASSYRGYKIHREVPEGGSGPFGEPVTQRATATIRTSRRHR